MNPTPKDKLKKYRTLSIISLVLVPIYFNVFIPIFVNLINSANAGGSGSYFTGMTFSGLIIAGAPLILITLAVVFALKAKKAALLDGAQGTVVSKNNGNTLLIITLVVAFFVLASFGMILMI